MVKVIYEANGRGAWNNQGIGGTLQLDRVNKVTKPGPYYMAPVNSATMTGLQVSKDIAAGKEVKINDYGVYLGVKELQKRLNKVLGASLVVDGIIGPRTDSYIRGMQHTLGVTEDGMLGPATAQALFLPIVKEESKKMTVDWTVPAGLMKKECSFDPSAVGYYDTMDLGMGQINQRAHPDFGIERCFDHVFAIDYVINRFKAAVAYFKGNIRDAVASYNLGYGGTLEWIKAGRPSLWIPSWDRVPRDTNQYIDDILGAF